MKLMLYQAFQYVALVAGGFFYVSLKRWKLLPFLFICLLAVIIESASKWVIYKQYSSNYFLINLYFLISTPLFLWGYFMQFRLNPLNQKRYKITAFVICILFLLNYLFLEGPVALDTLSIILQQFINILLTCGLLFQMATIEEQFNLSAEPMFWISAGLLIFSLGTLVVLGMNGFIRLNHITIQNKNLYRVIMPALNIILYTAYTYAFYLCMRKKKSYLPLS